MKPNACIRCLLVDPSLFTGPYDAALTEGLLAAGVAPLWATRPARRGEEDEIAHEHVRAIFYLRSDDTAVPHRLRALLKGCAHLAGLVRLLRLVASYRPHVVHVQWAVLPLLDAIVLWLIRWRVPVVMTVHDPTPNNGTRLTLLQRLGFDVPLRLADHLIVHTHGGRRKLVARGFDMTRVSVVPHGPLRLRARASEPRTDARYTFVLFGQIKDYKGVDVLVEALALLPREVRSNVRAIVAGRPLMDLAPLRARIAALSLEDTIELRPQRLSEQEMADLFEAADCFVFPYREIDASGVYFLTKGLRKWVIASGIGIFAEDIEDGCDGTLIPSGNAECLARALQHAATTRPSVPQTPIQDSWHDIGRATRRVYEHVLRRRTQAIPLAEEGAADVESGR